MIIGIDPGLTGAIAFFDDEGGLIEVVDMPTMAFGKKNQVNAAELGKIIRGFALFAKNEDSKLAVYLEQVNAMPSKRKDPKTGKMVESSQGAASMFNFGKGYGIVIGVVGAFKIPLVNVLPAQWKKHFSLIKKDKDNARTLAQHKFPEASLARKKDIGRADAILIGVYGCEQ